MSQETRPAPPPEPLTSAESPAPADALARIEVLEVSLAALAAELAALRASVAMSVAPDGSSVPGSAAAGSWAAGSWAAGSSRQAGGGAELTEGPPVANVGAAGVVRDRGPAPVDSDGGSLAGPEGPRSTRRALIGRAGMVAAGTAAGLVVVGAAATPAAALPGSPTVNADPKWTRYSGATAGPAFLFEAGTETAAGANPGEKAALAGSATGGASFLPTTGVLGYSSVAGGIGVEARADSGDGAALVARSLAGPTLRLRAGGEAPAVMPPISGTWETGDVLRTGSQLWYCKSGGTGAASRWSRLSEVGLTIRSTPYRAYDSRPGDWPGGRDGPFVSGTTRVLPLVVPAGTIPAGSTGALLNVTVAETVGSGYLQVYSASLTSPPATSNLNWYANGQTVANSVTTAVSSDRKVQVTVGCPVGAATEVVIDVFGFYA